MILGEKYFRKIKKKPCKFNTCCHASLIKLTTAFCLSFPWQVRWKLHIKILFSRKSLLHTCCLGSCLIHPLKNNTPLINRSYFWVFRRRWKFIECPKRNKSLFLSHEISLRVRFVLRSPNSRFFTIYIEYVCIIHVCQRVRWLHVDNLLFTNKPRT